MNCFLIKDNHFVPRSLEVHSERIGLFACSHKKNEMKSQTILGMKKVDTNKYLLKLYLIGCAAIS